MTHPPLGAENQLMLPMRPRSWSPIRKHSPPKRDSTA